MSKTFVYFCYWMLSSFFIHKYDNQSVVLMYHSVCKNPKGASVSPDDFERQMRFLSQHKKVVPLHEIVDAQIAGTRLSSDTIAVTFDDGYHDLLITVLPIISKCDIPITVFVPSDLSVRTNREGSLRLDKESLRDIASSELVTIESHGTRHTRLTTLDFSEVLLEAIDSRQDLENYTGTRPNFFAYPYGAKNSLVEKAIVKAGYSAAFGITDGVVGSSGSMHALHRVQIDQGMSFLLFRLRLTVAVESARIVRRCIRKYKYDL